jgi:hypothetical protein
MGKENTSSWGDKISIILVPSGRKLSFADFLELIQQKIDRENGEPWRKLAWCRQHHVAYWPDD